MRGTTHPQSTEPHKINFYHKLKGHLQLSDKCQKENDTPHHPPAMIAATVVLGSISFGRITRMRTSMRVDSRMRMGDRESVTSRHRWRTAKWATVVTVPLRQGNALQPGYFLLTALELADAVLARHLAAYAYNVDVDDASRCIQ